MRTFLQRAVLVLVNLVIVLGLLLAMRTAATPSLRATYQRRFIAAQTAELAAGLPEYDEHRHDIEGALRVAAAAKK